MAEFGLILTGDRIKELNARDWFYKILKENPEIVKVHPGIENPIMEGAIDHHIHSYPDFVYRGQDMIEVSIDAAKAKMRAVAFKDHFNLTASSAYLIQKHIDHLVETEELAQGVEVYGGLGLNFGMNVEAVRTALKYPKMKMIWFPTFFSAGYYRFAGKPELGGVPTVGSDGKVLPETEEIMKLAVENQVGMGFGHTDFIELLPLAKKAKELGARAVLDHPLLELNKLTYDEMCRIADEGVYVGTYCQPMIPSIYQPVADPFETIETIRKIGPERCIVGSDFGQVLHINSIDGIRIFIRALIGFGVPEKDISIMLKDNPAKLLYLDE